MCVWPWPWRVAIPRAKDAGCNAVGSDQMGEGHVCTDNKPTPSFSINDLELAKKASEPCSWRVLPSGRLGLPLAPLKCGKHTYLSTDGRTRLCMHGENKYMVGKLKLCSPRGGERPDDIACTCANLDGLAVGIKLKPLVSWIDPPVRYYDVLCASGAEQMVLPGGREARRLPFTSGRRAMWMLACGNIRCCHGNSHAVLRDIQKGHTQRKIRRVCDCEPGRRSWRLNRLQTRKALRDGGRAMQG